MSSGCSGGRATTRSRHRRPRTPGELTDGELLTLLRFAVLPDPAVWPQAAALLEAAAQGDAPCASWPARAASRYSGPSSCVVEATGRYLVDLSTPPPGTVCPCDHLPFAPELGRPTASGTMG